jgi:WD40 repeat protein/serine/threonine protein kinase
MMVLALLAARIKDIYPQELADLGRRGGASAGVSWRDILVGFGHLTALEAARLSALSPELLRVCEGGLADAAAALNAREHLDALMGAASPRPFTPPLGHSADTMDLPAISFPVREAESEQRTARLLSEARGRYRHISQQGSGGMGRVLLVHDNSVGRDIALKELMSDPLTNGAGPDTPVREAARHASRFLQEALITARLEHPNIVPVYEVGKRASGQLFYTMRLVRGSTLGEAIARCGSLAERLKLLPHFRDLCHAIAYAHSRGVIHRDIKPHNVMIGMFGETVVLDWGIAKVRGQDDVFASSISSMPHDIRENSEAWTQTDFGTAVGTPQYMSPEQAEGRIDDITPQSDVYALGVVLYEMLAGIAPFHAGSLTALLDKVSRGSYEPLERIAPGAPPELVGICRKAMQIRAQDRYVSVMELAEDIERWQAGLLVKAYEYRFVELARRYYRKRRALVNIIVACALLLVSAIGLSYWNVVSAREREREQRLIAERQTYAAQVLLAQQHIDDFNYGEARRLLDQTHPEYRNWEWGWLAAQCAQDDLTLETSGGYVFEARFSGNGARAVSVSTAGYIDVFDTKSGERLHTWTVPAGSVRMVDHHGERLEFVTANDDGTLRVYHPGEPQRDMATYKLSDASINSVRYSLRDQLIAADEAGQVHLGKADGTDFTKIPIARHPLWDAQLSPDGSKVLAWTKNDEVVVVDVSTEAVLASTSGTRPAWSPSGGELAVTQGSNLLVLNLATGQSRTLAGHAGQVNSIAYSPDGSVLLSASEDRSIRLWDAVTGALRTSLDLGHPVAEAAFSQDGTRVLGFTRKGLMRVWHGDGYAAQQDFSGHAMAVMCANFSADASRLISSSMDGTAKLWSIGGSPLRTDMLAPDSPIHGAAMAQNQSALATLHEDGKLQVKPLLSDGAWRLSTASPEWASAAAFANNGSHLVAALDAFTPVVLDTKRGEVLRLLRGGSAKVRSTAGHPESPLAVTGDWEGGITLWNTESGDAVTRVEAFDEAVSALTFNVDGSQLAAASRTGKLRLYRSDGLELIKSLEAPVELYGLSFMPDGSRLVVAGDEGYLALHELNVAVSPTLLHGHTGPVHWGGVDDDGGRLVSAGADGSVRIWDTLSGDLLASLKGRGSLRWAGLDGDNLSLLTAAQRDGAGLTRWHAVDWRNPDSDLFEATAGFREQVQRRREVWRDQGLRPEWWRTHLTTPEVLRTGIEALLVAMEQSPAASDMRMDPSPMMIPLAAVGLRSGMALRKVEALAMEDRSGVIARLRELLGKPENSVHFEVEEEGRVRELHVITIEPEQEDQQVRLDRAELSKQLDAMLAYLSGGEQSLASVNDRRWEQLSGMKMLPRKERQGVWLNAPREQQEWAWMRTLKLTPGDKLTHLDGTSISTPEEMLRVIRTVRERAREATESFTVTARIERGAFVLRNLEYIVTP